jgi:branched-subunit amino acid aminotransferase/4-amino-4-deoxychorismate lyase
MQGPITVKDISEAAEMFMTGGSVPVAAVTEWDGRNIGDGTVGVMVLALRQMILNDMIPRKDSGIHTPVPYGALTGMPEDL